MPPGRPAGSDGLSIFHRSDKRSDTPGYAQSGNRPGRKVLPPGIAVGLTLENIINAEVGLVIVPVPTVFRVQLGKQRPPHVTAFSVRSPNGGFP